MEMILSGIKVNELLEMIGRLIDEKVGQNYKVPIVQQSKFISRKEVASLLKISLPTLNEWSKLGMLKSYKMGNRVLYNQEEVLNAIAAVSAYKHKKGGYHA